MITCDQVEKLATETTAPCVTISMNTNSTSPNNANDTITLKKLLKEAVSKGNVITNLEEIYQMALDGRGGLIALKTRY